MNSFLLSLKNYKIIFSNTCYLSIVEAMRLLMPFIALPYIIRTVGSENYGLVAFTQAVTVYFYILVNFGLDVYAVKEIAVHRENKQALSKIVSSVLCLKVFLSIAGLILLSVLVVCIPVFRRNALIMYFSYISVFAEVLLLMAFFQGIEKMQNITIIRAFSILFYFVFLFVFVRQREDYIYVPLLQSLGLLLSSLVGIFLMLKVYGIRLYIPALKNIRIVFKSSVPFFISRVSVVINNNLAKLLAGFCLGMQEVAVLDIAQKICSAGLIPLGMIDQAVYPHNAKQQDRKFATKTLFLVLGAGIIIAAFMFLLSPWVIRLLGNNELNDAIPLTQILCGYLILCSITYYIGSPVLVAFGHPKEFNMSVIVSTILTVIAYSILWACGFLSLYSFVLMLLFTEIIILVYRMFYCLKYKLL